MSIEKPRKNSDEEEPTKVEHPPEMTDEDEALLDEIWDRIGTESGGKEDAKTKAKEEE